MASRPNVLWFCDDFLALRNVSLTSVVQGMNAKIDAVIKQVNLLHSMVYDMGSATLAGTSYSSVAAGNTIGVFVPLNSTICIANNNDDVVPASEQLCVDEFVPVVSHSNVNKKRNKAKNRNKSKNKS